MPLVVLSLLREMVRLDAQSLVLHVGALPYMVGPSDDRRDVGSRALPAVIVDHIAKQLLPRELQVAFEEVGEIRYMLPTMEELPGQQFTVVGVIDRSLRVEVHRRLSEEALVLPPAHSLWPAA